ncbi:MAG: hypothetical protein AAGE65_13705 [Planctomycetota bacterium]
MALELVQPRGAAAEELRMAKIVAAIYRTGFKSNEKAEPSRYMHRYRRKPVTQDPIAARSAWSAAFAGWQKLKEDPDAQTD